MQLDYLKSTDTTAEDFDEVIKVLEFQESRGVYDYITVRKVKEHVLKLKEEFENDQDN